MFRRAGGLNLSKLQTELYGVSTLEEALKREGQLKDDQPKAGVCPNQWRAQEIAFRCLDCELDNNCVQCSDCFFKAKHEGHEVQVIRTVGGSCDCGDPSSWHPQGFCPEHCETPARLDSAEALDLLPPVISMGAPRLLPCLLEEVDNWIKKPDETRGEQVIEILELLQRFGEVIGLRYLVQEELQGERINLWLAPPPKLAEAMERFFLLYVQVSPTFKRRFSKLFAQSYQRLCKEASQLCSLSVQLFTIPEVALDLLDEGILESLLQSVERIQNGLVEIKDGVRVLKTISRSETHEWDQLFRSLVDLNFLLYHAPVCQYVLRSEQVQMRIVELLMGLWRVRPQKREERAHVLYEARHSEGFVLESELLKHLTHLADFCRRPEATMEELRSWYSAISKGLQRCESFSRDFNCSASSSFHMPLLRLLAMCMNWELLQDTSLAEEWREIFPQIIPVHGLTHAVRCIRFEAEIQTGWWVRNGQSMHQQQAEYRRRFRQWDLMTVQACLLLLNFHEAKEAEPLSCLWRAAFDETPLELTPQVSIFERWRRLWSDELEVHVKLRFRLFWTVLAQAINEMLPIEVSLCRRKWESRYARCSVILQRFLIQVLAKPMGMSELSALIPKELQVRETQLSEALDHVATRTDRNFQLKTRSWSFFDCCMAEAMPSRQSRELQHDAEEAALQQQVSLLGPRRSDGLALAPKIQDMMVDSLRHSELVPLMVEFIQLQRSATQSMTPSRYHPAQSEDALLYCLKVLDIISDAQTPHTGGASALASQLCAVG